MKNYEKTQETGIFFNQIPAHWEIKRGKEVIDILSGYPFASELFDIDAALGFPLIRIRNVVTGATDTYYKGDVLPEYVINPGDILIGMDGDYNCAMWNSEPALLNQRVCRVKGRNGLLDKYLFYSLPFHLQIINDLTYFTTVKHLSSNDIKEISLPVPPLPEQRAIAAYLDYKTAQLDTLLAQKETLLQKLHQKRQALINEAVTQGLDPAAPRKPSGVAWLGDVPAHWEVKKLKYCVQLNSNEIEDDGNGLRVALENIESKTGKYIPTETAPFEGPGNSFKTGDVLFSKLRPYLAKALLASQNGVAVGEILVLSPIEEMLNNAFLLNRVLSPSFIEVVDSSTYGSKMPRASWNFIGEMKISIPPLVEQESIVDFIDDITGKINEATAAIHTQIKTLKAYRQSLISEVVTGKVDVRPTVPVPEADLPLWQQ